MRSYNDGYNDIMKLLKIANKHLYEAIDSLIWNTDDITEVHAIYGGDIPLRFSLSDYDYYVIYDDDGVISIMTVDDIGYLTYFTTERIKDINLLKYIRFFKKQIDLYQKLFDVVLVTEVWKEYTAAIRFLELLGFNHTYTDGDILTYGKQKENNI